MKIGSHIIILQVLSVMSWNSKISHVVVLDKRKSLNLFGNLKETNYYFKALLLFSNSFLKKELGLRKTWTGYFGLYTKLKKGSGTRFWYICSAQFFPEILPHVIYYKLAKFQYQISTNFQDIQQYVHIMT